MKFADEETLKRLRVFGQEQVRKMDAEERAAKQANASKKMVKHKVREHTVTQNERASPIK